LVPLGISRSLIVNRDVPPPPALIRPADIVLDEGIADIRLT